MKNILIVILLVCIYPGISYSQSNKELFPIKDKNLYGFIDKSGNVVIEPKYLSVNEFSEGLAPVRLNGTYGFINEFGNYEIEPIYDLALPFYKGIAKVYIDGIPYFIDKSGNIKFKHNFKYINNFGDLSYAIAISFSDKYGVIDKNGNLIIDTIYSNIENFENGIAIVTGQNHNPYPTDKDKKPVYEKSMIDSSGNKFIYFGKYQNISKLKNGFAFATLIDFNNDEHEVILDNKGVLKFRNPKNKWRFDNDFGFFHDDIAIVNVYFDNNIKGLYSSGIRNYYSSAVNSEGKILFSDTSWIKLTAFTLNRAFVELSSGEWNLINPKGELISNNSYNDVLFDDYLFTPEYTFLDGKAFVKSKTGWGVIDTNGKYLINPINILKFTSEKMVRRKNMVFLKKDVSSENDIFPYSYGFWDTENNIIVEPQFNYIDFNGFANSILFVINNSKGSYIDHYGNVVWQESDFPPENKINIDYMLRGYFYASSKNRSDLNGYGGWWKSDNKSKFINSELSFEEDILQVRIDTSKITVFEEQYNGITLYVANTSKDTTFFNAQDSRINLVLQAKNKFGEWKDIEYLPQSWCGNSFHTLFLAKNELWEFSIPVYYGDFKTQIRAKLMYKNYISQKNEIIVYSNEINGSINPGQFWYKKSYYPSDIMDPYSE